MNKPNSYELKVMVHQAIYAHMSACHGLTNGIISARIACEKTQDPATSHFTAVVTSENGLVEQGKVAVALPRVPHRVLKRFGLEKWLPTEEVTETMSSVYTGSITTVTTG